MTENTYCEHCGKQLTEESVRSSRCQGCGELKRTSGRGPWPVLFLITLAALVVTVVIHVNQPPESVEVAATDQEPAAVLPSQYELPASFADLGPRLIEAGAIDLAQFVATYDRAGQPLNEAQLAILQEGSDEAIVIDRSNAYFLLNFFWALGLTNDNPILTEGPMMTNSEGNPGRFASVGGWTIGQKPPQELYASAHLVHLTDEQQRRVEEVAQNVYRPCCNNHTAFADCNHGMALLGMLQLMAGQGATVDELYESAKYVSAFWYPQQATETAIFFEKNMNLAYADVDPRMAVGPEVFSGSGFKQVHDWLVANNALPQPSGDGNSCGV
nr:hypothetical protein [uncultured bacterium]